MNTLPSKTISVAFRSYTASRCLHRSAALSSEHHTVLGVAENATTAEIKAAYLKKCHELHPDKNEGDKKKHDQFLQLNKSYDILLTHKASPETPSNATAAHKGFPGRKEGYKSKGPRISNKFWQRFFWVCVAFPFVYSFCSYNIIQGNYHRHAEKEFQLEMEKIQKLKEDQAK